MKKSQASAKQVINAKVAAAKAAAAGKVQDVVKTETVQRVKTVVDAKRVQAAQQAIEATFASGEALNTCNTIKHLTREGYTPLEIIAATGFNKVTVYRQSAEANFQPAVNSHE